MAKKGTATRSRGDGRASSKSVRRLERHLAALAREQKALRKRMKRLARRLDTAPPPPLPPAGPPGPDTRGGPGRRRGGAPWAKGLGPVVSLEVPLETDDPTAPLWATVAARLPEEITTVGDDGRVARYRYAAVGSTPQAPRYRRLAEPPTPPSPAP